LRRGDIYTAATGHGYGSKPRPVLIIQSDDYGTVEKKLVALIGSPDEGTADIRVPVEPDDVNNLVGPSEIMVDAILPVRPEKFGRPVGRLARTDMQRVEQALLAFLGIGES